MNGLDIFFVVVLGFFLFRGIFRGLILEVSSIAGLVAGFLASNKFYADLQPVVNRIISSPDWSQVVAYLGIFFTTILVIGMLSHLLKKLLQMIMLGWMDRLGGGVLGFVKAGLICVLTLLILTVFLPRDHELITTSRISPYVHNISQNLAGYLPEELKEKFRDKAETAKSFLEENWEEFVMPKKGEL
jgi:membrane protein required for colicin V production